MNEQDFQEYLAKYGCKEDEEGMSEEENCQLEVIKFPFFWSFYSLEGAIFLLARSKWHL